MLTVSPSGSTPLLGTVIVSGSPAVTEVVKDRATGARLGRAWVGSGVIETDTRPVWARSGSPSG